MASYASQVNSKYANSASHFQDLKDRWNSTIQPDCAGHDKILAQERHHCLDTGTSQSKEIPRHAHLPGADRTSE